MKKIILFLNFILIMSMFIGCKKETSYNFLNDVSEIKEVYIVELGEANESGEYQQSIIGSIDDINVFLADFKAIDCHILYSDPKGVSVGEIVIKITYINNEYELIGKDGQADYRNDDGFDNYVGYRYFDEEQFEKLINKYSLDIEGLTT